jgi:hypothetical protein
MLFLLSLSLPGTDFNVADVFESQACCKWFELTEPMAGGAKSGWSPAPYQNVVKDGMPVVGSIVHPQGDAGHHAYSKSKTLHK